MSIPNFRHLFTDTYLIRAPNLIWAVRLKMLMIII